MEFQRLESLLADTNQEDDEANGADAEADIEDVGISGAFLRLELKWISLGRERFTFLCSISALFEFFCIFYDYKCPGFFVWTERYI